MQKPKYGNFFILKDHLAGDKESTLGRETVENSSKVKKIYRVI